MTGQEHLINGPIAPEMVSALTAPGEGANDRGAQAFFLGKVRSDSFEGRTVAAIEYSAYEAMVGGVVEEIRTELFHAFSGLVSVGVWHSTGLVKSGEISLLVMVTSGHRRECFGALEMCVERIKEKLPVWKKEIFTDGSSRWIE